jgi:hypothetical protein
MRRGDRIHHAVEVGDELLEIRAEIVEMAGEIAIGELFQRFGDPR